MMKGEWRIPQRRGLQRKEEEVWQEIVVQHHRRFRSWKKRKRITETFPYSFSQHCPALMPQQNVNKIQLNCGERSKSEEHWFFFPLSLNFVIGFWCSKLWVGLIYVEPTLLWMDTIRTPALLFKHPTWGASLTFDTSVILQNFYPNVKFLFNKIM